MYSEPHCLRRAVAEQGTVPSGHLLWCSGMLWLNLCNATALLQHKTLSDKVLWC